MKKRVPHILPGSFFPRTVKWSDILICRDCFIVSKTRDSELEWIKNLNFLGQNAPLEGIFEANLYIPQE